MGKSIGYYNKNLYCYNKSCGGNGLDIPSIGVY
jgi:hypothetical protein